MSEGPVRHTARPRRSIALASVLALLFSVLGLAVGASPASAIVVFTIDAFSEQPAIAGAEADIVISVYNGGDEPSLNTFLEVTLPAGLEAVGGDPCVVPGSCLIGSFGTVNAGETVYQVIRVAIDPDFVLDNGGGATSANAALGISVDHDGGSQSASRQVPVGEESNLRVRKYANPPVANAGEIVSYGIDVDNLGPSTARTVTISDTLFGGVGTPTSTLTIQSCAFSVSQGGGAINQFDCTTGPVVTGQFGIGIGTFVTDRLDPIGLYPGPNPGDPDVVGGRLRAAFRLVSTDAITLDNEVRVISATSDPDLSNNLAVATTSITAAADLAVTKTAAAPVAGPGEEITYTLTATNEGPSDAINVVLTDHLPAGLELVSVATPTGVCTGGYSGAVGDPVVCRLGTIEGPIGTDPPSEVVVTITARVDASTTPGSIIANWASITSDTTDLVNANDAAQVTVTVVEPDLLFNPVTPSRQFDTRDGTGGVPVAKVPAGVALEFTVTGVNGIPVGASAVALNVAVVGPDEAGWLSVYPCATPPTLASNLNYVQGQTVANAVIAPVDAAGKVCFLTTAATDIISDVSGWFRPADGLTTFTPAREFDTRFGSGGVPVGKRPAESTLSFTVTGVNGVPASGVSAVVLNVTVTQPETEGFITVFACGTTPLASNVNYVRHQTVPNLVIAPVSPQGKVCFYTSADTHLLADVSGWFADGSDQHALNPTRLFDTRSGLGGVPATKLIPGGMLEIPVTGRNGVPATGVGAVILNVTTVWSDGVGYVTVFPCGDRPLTSSVNFVPGKAVPNAVVAPVSSSGTVCLYTNVGTELLADISGWFAG